MKPRQAVGGDAQQLLQKEGGFVTRVIAGETIIVPISSGVGDLDAIFTLNEVGTEIWNLIDGQTSMAQMVDVIVDRYEISRETARSDIAEFLAILEARRLVRPSHADA